MLRTQHIELIKSFFLFLMNKASFGTYIILFHGIRSCKKSLMFIFLLYLNQSPENNEE